MSLAAGTRLGACEIIAPAQDPPYVRAPVVANRSAGIFTRNVCCRISPAHTRIREEGRRMGESKQAGCHGAFGGIIRAINFQDRSVSC